MLQSELGMSWLRKCNFHCCATLGTVHCECTLCTVCCTVHCVLYCALSSTLHSTLSCVLYCVLSCAIVYCALWHCNIVHCNIVKTYTLTLYTVILCIEARASTASSPVQFPLWTVTLTVSVTVLHCVHQVHCSLKPCFLQHHPTGMHCALYTVHCAICTVHWQFALCTVTLYTVCTVLWSEAFGSIIQLVCIVHSVYCSLKHHPTGVQAPLCTKTLYTVCSALFFAASFNWNASPTNFCPLWCHSDQQKSFAHSRIFLHPRQQKIYWAVPSFKFYHLNVLGSSIIIVWID